MVLPARGTGSLMCIRYTRRIWRFSSVTLGFVRTCFLHGGAETKRWASAEVLGASVQSILYLFSKNSTILVIIAFCTGSPRDLVP